MSKFSNKTFIVDCKIDSKIENFLNQNNINYIKTVKNDNLYEEINSHPDIISCNLGDFTIIEPYSYYKLFDKIKNFNIKKGSSILNAKYPYDIAYNCIFTDKYLIGKIKYLDLEIKKYAQLKNLEFIDVKQGYTRCSTIVLRDNIFISSDKNIYNTLKSKSIKSYLFETQDIYLSDRYIGFLGGACVSYEDEIIFFGNIDKLKNYQYLQEILIENDIKYKNIDLDKLTDYGSMIQI